MTAITSAKFLGFKKNKTGLFAAHSIYDMKPPVRVPESHLRTNGSASLFYPSVEQRQLAHQAITQATEQRGPLDDSAGNSTLTLTGRRSGFPPSIIRHQKIGFMTATPPRSHPLPSEHRDSSSRSTAMQSHTSARLKSEVSYLRNKLKRHEELSKSVRLQDSRDLNSTSHGTLSYSTSCRLPSASTIQTADRIHKRFSSAATHQTVNTLLTMPTINDASTQTLPILSKPVVATAPVITETDGHHQPDRAEHRPTYAYQIPQQSNVGSESVFLADSSVLSAVKARADRLDRSHHHSKSVTCPFYVMYLTNLTMQQAQPTEDRISHNDHPLPASNARRVPVNSRTTTALLQRHSTRTQANSRTSINTYPATDDNSCPSAYSIASPRHNRLLTAMDNEHSSKLGDILRTTSWNHVRV